MGKAGFIMQGARGRLGDTIYYKGEKGTYQRVRVAPRNAKTAKQMAQRIIFATVNQAAAWMKSLVNHSFENVPEGEMSVREFTRLNLSLLRNYAADDFANTPDAVDAKVFTTTKGISTLIPNRYIVSRGTLQLSSKISLAWKKRPEGQNEYDELTLTRKKFNINGKVTAVDGEGDKIQVAEIEIKALDFLKLLGIESINDQLSMVFVGVNKDNILFQYGDDAAVPGFVIKQGLYNVVRAVPSSLINENTTITVDVYDHDGDFHSITLSRGQQEKLFDRAKTDWDFVTWLTGSVIGEKTGLSYSADAPTVGMDILIEYEDDETIDNYWDDQNLTPLADNFSTRMAGLIRSSFNATSNKWLRSTCVLDGQGPVDYNNYGLIWAITNDAWNRSVEIAANNLFLDQGGKGGTIE